MWGLARPFAVCLLLLLISCCEAIEYRCDGTPEVKSPARTGLEHFAIKISGNPDTYSPLRKYAVSLEPTRQGLQSKFVGFALMVETVRSGEVDNVGTFHLIDEALTKYSDKCPHMVIETSSRLKSEFAVHWVAPASGTGCVTFRATVIEPGEVWYMNEGHLSRTICEDAESADELPFEVQDCCACDEAKYEVTFEGLWSRHTHPKDFPPNGWLTRFSDVIGASHSGDYRFWQYGELASEGLKQVAERGWTRMLESELKSESENIRTIIKARGISYPNVTGKTFAVFRVDKQHHLMSLVSMIVPSPDWIVGVSGLELCLKNCSWVESKVLNLNPWDCGTDSGVTYTSPDSPTDPPEPIRQITSSDPDNEGSPFYDPTGEKMKPLARLHITRQRLYEKSCSDDTIAGDDDENSGDCAVGEWTPGSCSVSCGRGVKYYQRFYVNPELALMARCNVALTKRETCQASRWCSGEPQLPLSIDETPSMAKDPRCDVTDWTDWSGCSATCGRNAVKTRSRRYRLRGGRKICGDAQLLQETMPCELDDCENEEEADNEETCEPLWSDWTPCSVTCGTGFMSRSTSGHSYSSDGTKCSGHPRTQQVECEGQLPTCNYTAENRADICLLHADKGDCRMSLERWYFDKNHVMCREFIYSGCKGNGNMFMTKEECEQACSGVVDGLNAVYTLGAFGVISSAYEEPNENNNVDVVEISTTDSSIDLEEDPMSKGDTSSFRGIPADSLRNGSYYNYNTYHETSNGNDAAVNCKVSSWSEWSPCSVTCGRGLKDRYRRIKIHPRNGGKPCPELRMERKCKKHKCDAESNRAASDSEEVRATWGEAELPPRKLDECVMGAWSPWSECSAECGPEAFQMRTRVVIKSSSMGGGCREETFQSRSCHLLPCV